MNLTFLGWSKMEIKSFGQIVLLCSAVMTLAACQSLDTARLKKIQETPSTQANAKLYCSGVEVCEFERLGPTFIVKERNHRINRDAMEQGIVRINLQAIDANKVYLSVQPKQHEVVIRFILCLRIVLKSCMSYINLRQIRNIHLICTVNEIM